MSRWAKLLILLVAILHVGFLIAEMFLWTTSLVRGAFNLDERFGVDFAEKSRSLAANQGLYNGFLAAGLVWSLKAPADLGRKLAFFFLGCVVVAGVFGAFTVPKISILLVQALPAAIALLVVIFA